MSDADQQEPLIVCDLREAVSIDELHTAKAALSGAGFILEEDLSEGQIEIHRAGPDDQVALPDEYQDRVTEEIEETIDEAMESFKKELEQLADQSEEQAVTEETGDEEEADELVEDEDTEEETVDSDEDDEESDEDESETTYSCGNCGQEFGIVSPTCSSFIILLVIVLQSTILWSIILRPSIG